jgi:endonuclease/exonuclease/phosphatase family metal-dependent hydrolase
MLSPPPPQTLKLLTLNVHKGVSAWRRPILDKLKSALAGVGADVVCLQEVRGGSARASPQYEALADGLWSEHAYGRNAATSSGDHGNAVLSRWPILSARNHDLSLPGDEVRSVLHCVLDMPPLSRALHVMCVHLGLRESHRHLQMKKLLGLVQTLEPDAPLVVAGDFNDWRQRADRALAGAGLQEVHVRHHGTPALTFPARWPLLALDRIYLRGLASCRPLAMPRQPWRDLSDHVPVAAAMTLAAEAP